LIHLPSRGSAANVKEVQSGGEIARLKELKLVPGMPVEAFIQTGERTALSYFVKPLSDQLSRAWKEDYRTFVAMEGVKVGLTVPLPG
jgi:hypothetical protein